MSRRQSEDINFAEMFEDARADYNAGRQTRFARRRRGIAASGSGADYHYRSDADYLRMMEVARDMDRNDVVIGPALDRLIANVVQTGFALEPQTGNDDLDKFLTDEFTDWATEPTKCDYSGEFNFACLTEKVLRSTYVDGDIFGIPIRLQGSIQLVEGHRCRTPKKTKRNVIHGVLLDAKSRRRKEYWFTKEDVGLFQTVKLVNEIEPFKAFDDSGHRAIFHVADPKRYTQTRGVSALAAPGDTAGMFEDINFARLVQQQSVSAWAILRERAQSFKTGSGGKTGKGDTIEEQADGSQLIKKAMGPGMEWTGAPGEKLTGFSPNVPNPEYFDHIRLMLTLVGLHLKLPLILLLMDAGETNFSGWRGAMNQAKQEFRRIQSWLIARWHRPVYIWWIRHKMATDTRFRKFVESKISDKKVQLFKHLWNPPGWAYIQPLQDAQAHALRRQSLQTSPSRGLKELGLDYAQILSETIRDNKAAAIAAIKAAQEVEKETDGVKIDWHELLYIPSIKPLSGTLSSGEGDTDETGADRDTKNNQDKKSE